MLPTSSTPQYNWLLQEPSDSSHLRLPVANQKHITRIENAAYLEPSEKLQLLLVLTRLAFAGEISLANQDRKVQLLKHLNLPYFINSYKHSRKGLIQWIQVAANERISQFIKKHSQTMSPLEAGLLYNYPTTAILAFMGLIPKQSKFRTRTAADYFFGIVHSRDWLEAERSHYRKVFRQIKKISPKIAKELELKYRELTKLRKRHEKAPIYSNRTAG